MTFLTEYMGSLPSGRIAKLGGEIEAASWKEAKRKGEKLGLTVKGPLIEETEDPEMREFSDREARRRDDEWKR